MPKSWLASVRASNPWFQTGLKLQLLPDKKMRDHLPAVARFCSVFLFLEAQQKQNRLSKNKASAALMGAPSRYAFYAEFRSQFWFRRQDFDQLAHESTPDNRWKQEKTFCCKPRSCVLQKDERDAIKTASSSSITCSSSGSTQNTNCLPWLCCGTHT